VKGPESARSEVVLNEAGIGLRLGALEASAERAVI
jgi:hypothetical protein